MLYYVASGRSKNKHFFFVCELTIPMLEFTQLLGKSMHLCFFFFPPLSVYPPRLSCFISSIISNHFEDRYDVWMTGRRRVVLFTCLVSHLWRNPTSCSMEIQNNWLIECAWEHWSWRNISVIHWSLKFNFKFVIFHHFPSL